MVIACTKAGGGIDHQSRGGDVCFGSTAVCDRSAAQADVCRSAECANADGSRGVVADVAGAAGEDAVIHGYAAVGEDFDGAAARCADVRFLGEAAVGGDADVTAAAVYGKALGYCSGTLQQDVACACGGYGTADGKVAAAIDEDDVAACSCCKAADCKGITFGDEDATCSGAGAECADGGFKVVAAGANAAASGHNQAGGGDVSNSAIIACGVLIENIAGRGGKGNVAASGADGFYGDVAAAGSEGDGAVVAGGADGYCRCLGDKQTACADSGVQRYNFAFKMVVAGASRDGCGLIEHFGIDISRGLAVVEYGSAGDNTDGAPGSLTC